MIQLQVKPNLRGYIVCPGDHAGITPNHSSVFSTCQASQVWSRIFSTSPRAVQCAPMPDESCALQFRMLTRLMAQQVNPKEREQVRLTHIKYKARIKGSVLT